MTRPVEYGHTAHHHGYMPPMCPRNAERDRQMTAAINLLGTGIPPYLRLSLRAFIETLEPAVNDNASHSA